MHISWLTSEKNVARTIPSTDRLIHEAASMAVTAERVNGTARRDSRRRERRLYPIKRGNSRRGGREAA